MKFLKIRFLSMMVIGVMAFVLSGCGGSGGGGTSPTPIPTNTPVVLEEISISPANLTLPIGVEVQYQATGRYNDGSSKNITSEVVWTSSDSAVATIDSTGKVTSTSIGTASINAVAGEVSASTKVIVGKELATELASIQLTFENGDTEVSVPNGTTGSLVAMAVMTDGRTFDATRWVSFDFDKTVISIAQSGINAGDAKAIGVGNSNIVAKYENVLSNIVKITVTNAVLVSLSICPEDETVIQGDTVHYSAYGIFSDSDQQRNITKDCTWRSSKPEVAKINVGKFTADASATKVGETVISATYGPGLEVETSLTVESPILESMELTFKNGSQETTVPAGTTEELVLRGHFSNGDDKDITLWKNVKYNVQSDNKAVDVIVKDDRVNVRALREGDAFITAYYDDKPSNTVKVSVTVEKLVSIEVILEPSEIEVNDISLLRAKGLYTDGHYYWITYNVSWVSKPTDIAVIREGILGPRARGKKAGTAVISATLDGESGDATLMVK